MAYGRSKWRARFHVASISTGKQGERRMGRKGRGEGTSGQKGRLTGYGGQGKLWESREVGMLGKGSRIVSDHIISYLTAVPEYSKFVRK